MAQHRRQVAVDPVVQRVCMRCRVEAQPVEVGQCLQQAVAMALADLKPLGELGKGQRHLRGVQATQQTNALVQRRYQ